MLIIGLTGGIACGKSTVSSRLKTHYRIPVIDADAIARRILDPGQNAYKRVIRYFSGKVSNLVLADGSINRAALGAYIFANPEERKVLNGITHPEVRHAILLKILMNYLKFHAMCILDVPLLFEANLDIICGITVCVVCDRDLQLQRLMERNPELTEELALARIEAQMSMYDRISRSDYLIDNNGDIKELFGNIDGLLTYIKPSAITVWLEYFPPYGFVAALSVIFSRYLKQRWPSKFTNSSKKAALRKDKQQDDDDKFPPADSDLKNEKEKTPEIKNNVKILYHSV
ncbi:putative dephospho-CoA kinase [Kluyveromyces lactis]|uniref:KLLA0D18711p n=1 Tax=Kluyveromyces lactis (strain ATCC 8585 / CBS 2359 / DSM 70799 / NBRC 1267 / NRRL Y-1140 / WM37) TaxID=284590 RepID=Q6CQ99_KLULA|nr:uncharacterized protein KLLA0_D18711g [Kluyveromyces lactis]CAH00986.1 KLLA0D18711p [Kluyveromyces lactis]|eukprot:XP_453890.1 uncharacterized protein KLLA0_D18711g [Kluyveromyces lactis]